MFQLRSPSPAIIEAKISMFLSEQGPAMIERFAACLGEHGGTSGQIGSVSIDMSPAFEDAVCHCQNFRQWRLRWVVCRSALVMSGEHRTTCFGSS
jgi:hypothetical protein